MAYSKLAELPAYVQKLPEDKQRQWQIVFNESEKAGQDEGASTRIANGVAKKALPDFEPVGEYAAAENAAVIQAEKNYQYVDSYEYESRQLSQEQAGYNPVGGSGTKACSNCFFFVSPARCTQVRGVIASNGVSNRWQAVEPAVQPPLEVVIVGGIDLLAAKETPPVPPSKPGVKEDSLFGRIAKFITQPVSAGAYVPEPTAASRNEALCIVKQADGQMRWITRYSNAWEDKEKELLLEAAHKEYIAWAYDTKKFPELWLWHTPGTRFGKADFLDFDSGFSIASGLVDNGKEHIAEALAASSKQLGVSHGFLSVQDGKYITKYRTFEISVLPLERAAAWGTSFDLLGGTDMALTKERRSFMVQALGEEAVASLEKSTEAAAKEMERSGAEYKEVTAGTETAPPAHAEVAAVNEAVKGLTDVTLASLDQIKTLATQVKELGLVVASIKATDDEKVAEAFKARTTAANAARPTDGAGNLVPGAEGPRVDSKEQGGDFLFGQLSGLMQGGAALAAAGAAQAVAGVSVR